MKTPLFIGIDPGIKGAAGIVNFEQTFAKGYPFKMKSKGSQLEQIKSYNTLSWLTEFILHNCDRPIVIAIERVNPRPGQNVNGVFTFGKSLGAVYAALYPVCGLSNVSVSSIEPSAWQKEFKLVSGKEYEQKKKDNRIKAINTFADYDITVTHQTADALLIAEFLRRNANQSNLLFEGSKPITLAHHE